MNFFERWLTLWVLLCIVVGIALCLFHLASGRVVRATASATAAARIS